MDSKLSEKLERLFNSIEKVAFGMKAPNDYTPMFIQYCILGRDLVNELKSHPTNIITPAVLTRCRNALLEARLQAAIKDIPEDECLGYALTAALIAAGWKEGV